MLKLDCVDHVHVFTPERARAEEWYGRVLGLTRVKEYEYWATKEGPLFLSNSERSVALALFERPAQSTRSTIAFRVSGEDFLSWRTHLRELAGTVREVDHDGSWSLYFNDPDGNPFEITSYDYQWLKEQRRDDRDNP
jgi:catechol 2,3-dioxygenase-like lactoylglutathione lyase family enzyme